MHGKNSFYSKHIKRILDVGCALAAMIAFCWLFVIIAVLVRVKLGGPIIFRTQRVGKAEKVFTLYKFRTMSNERDENGKLLPDERRVNRFGRCLRSLSLDELPEVWNILRGDLSVVGPRPLPEIYLNYYTEDEKHRHDVKPGLTGLAQVNGRNNLRWEEKFAFDLAYTNNCSFLLDVKIVGKTFLKVIRRQDVVTGDVVVIGEYTVRSLNIERSENSVV